MDLLGRRSQQKEKTEKWLKEERAMPRELGAEGTGNEQGVGACGSPETLKNGHLETER